MSTATVAIGAVGADASRRLHRVLMQRRVVMSLEVAAGCEPLVTRLTVVRLGTTGLGSSAVTCTTTTTCWRRVRLPSRRRFADSVRADVAVAVHAVTAVVGAVDHPTPAGTATITTANNRITTVHHAVAVHCRWIDDRIVGRVSIAGPVFVRMQMGRRWRQGRQRWSGCHPTDGRRVGADRTDGRGRRVWRRWSQASSERMIRQRR